jgi:hypothetical protein
MRYIKAIESAVQEMAQKIERGSDIAILAPSYDVAQHAVRLILERLDALPRSHRVPLVVDRGHFIVFQNGARLSSYSASDNKPLRGMTHSALLAIGQYETRHAREHLMLSMRPDADVILTN